MFCAQQKEHATSLSEQNAGATSKVASQVRRHPDMACPTLSNHNKHPYTVAIAFVSFHTPSIPPNTIQPLATCIRFNTTVGSTEGQTGPGAKSHLIHGWMDHVDM